MAESHAPATPWRRISIECNKHWPIFHFPFDEIILLQNKWGSIVLPLINVKKIVFRLHHCSDIGLILGS
jgi:hypothetical protein